MCSSLIKKTHSTEWSGQNRLRFYKTKTGVDWKDRPLIIALYNGENTDPYMHYRLRNEAGMPVIANTLQHIY